MFAGKTLLITGGTGSFGNAVLKRFLTSDIGEIRIFSRDEKKQEDMRALYSNSKLRFYIGDVRNLSSISDAMKGVDYVFHAAALKQVPSCEFYPMEAVRTNILGAENVMVAASSCGVKRVILLSTDKAVYPINAMGLSKAMMEKLMIARARMAGPRDPILCATRYGNVMASRGSVIPLFIKQIRTNKAITITEPGMTRFLMSLEDSVNLVLYAFTRGVQGSIFVQKSPAATIETLAHALQEIFKSNSAIQLIGTRHGEKLYETLVSREEMAKSTDEGSYYSIPSDNRDLNYAKYSIEGDLSLNNFDDYTSHNTVRLDVSQTRALLLQQDFMQEALNA